MTIFIGGLFDPFGQDPADWMSHKSFSPLSSYFHVFIPHYFFVKLKNEICPKLGNSIQGTCCKMKKSSIMIIHVIMLKLQLFGFNNLNAVLYHRRLHEIYSKKMALVANSPKVMLVTSWCRLHRYVGDINLVTISECWQNGDFSDIFLRDTGSWKGQMV